MATKHCFIDKERVCDLTCKAAFAVDDPLDPVDCYFIWLAAHVGEGLLDLRSSVSLQGGLAGFAGPGGGTGGSPPPTGGPGGTPPSAN